VGMADIYISKQKTEKSMEKKKTVGKVNPMPSGRTSGKKEESTHQQTLKELLPESTTNPLAAFSCYPTGLQEQIHRRKLFLFCASIR